VTAAAELNITGTEWLTDLAVHIWRLKWSIIAS
jgi:hypothetical protein